MRLHAFVTGGIERFLSNHALRFQSGKHLHVEAAALPQSCNLLLLCCQLLLQEVHLDTHFLLAL